MPRAPKVEGPPNHGLTPRELELTVKAMITLVENNVKPDYEKLAKIANFKDANAAAKNWWFTDRKLKAIGSKTDGEADKDNKAGGKKPGKREADDEPAAPPAKRGRARKTAPAPVGGGEAEEQKVGVNSEADEV